VSLQAKILSLIAGITDPVVRVDVASTINFLFDVYAGGGIKEDELRSELYSICVDVISGVHPELTEEEVRRISRTTAEEFMRIFKVESLRRRIMTRIRGRISLPI